MSVVDPFPRLATWAQERKTWAKHPLPWKFGMAYNSSAAIFDAKGDVVINSYVADVSLDEEFISTMEMIVKRNNEFGAEMAKPVEEKPDHG